MNMLKVIRAGVEATVAADPRPLAVKSQDRFANPSPRKATPAGAAVLGPFEALVLARNEKGRLQCLAAAQRVAAGQQPQCAWMGHRHQVVREEAGQVIECCMDCGGGARTYPVGKTSKDAKPYLGAI